VKLYIYTRSGELVKKLIAGREYQKPGVDHEAWDGRNEQGNKLAPGTYVYLYELTSGGQQTEQVRRRLMIR
jgi:flagellar hook assembly protein FlgD